MSIYRYPEPSVIREIEMCRSAGGGMRSFLYCDSKVTAEQIQNVKNALRSHSCHCVATEYDGRPCLEIRGLRKIEALESALRPDFLKGSPTKSDSDEKSFSFGELMRNNLMLLYGIMNIFGDVGMVVYSKLKKKLGEHDNIAERAAAWTYTSGSVIFTLFGRGDKSDHHVRSISFLLREEMRNRGIPLPETSAAYSFTTDSQKGLIGDSMRFIEQHPAEIGNALTAGAGGLFAKNALSAMYNNELRVGMNAEEMNKVSRKDKEYAIDAATGFVTFAGGMTAAFTKEKSRDLRKDGAGFSLRNWVRERPNRVAGLSYMLSTIAHGYQGLTKFLSAKEDYKGNSKNIAIARWAYGWRMLFAATNAIDEVILTFASKGHGYGVKSDKSVDDTTYAIVADAIIRQPQEEQERLIVDLSKKFLSRPEILGSKPQEAEAQLRSVLARLARNPWSPRNAEAFAATAEPEQPQRSANWQEKEMRRAPAEMAASFA